VEKQNQNEIYYDGKWHYISPEGSKHEITSTFLFPNRIHNLCLVKGDIPEEITLTKIDEAKTREDKILSIPLGNILWLKLSPPYKGKMHSLFLDTAGDEVKMRPLLRKMVKTGVLRTSKS
jgi:hypothetical protein